MVSMYKFSLRKIHLFIIIFFKLKKVAIWYNPYYTYKDKADYNKMPLLCLLEKN